MRALLVFASLSAVSLGCGGFGPPAETTIDNAGRSIRVRDSGAVIVGGRQAAKLEASGKLVSNRGMPIAFLYDDRVRVKGGVMIPFRTAADGTIHLSTSAQEKAGLKMVTAKVTADGKLQRGKNGPATPIEGGADARTRRLLLLVLLLEENDLWPADVARTSGKATGDREVDNTGDLSGGDEAAGSEPSDAGESDGDKDGSDLDWDDGE